MSLTFEMTLPSKDEFWRLFATTGWNDEYMRSADELMSALSRSTCVVSAYDDGALVGFGRVVSDGALHAMIYDLIVSPDHQCRGIGAEILRRLVTFCRQEGISDIQLFCAKGKRHFYEQRGFRARPEDAPGMELTADLSR
jgi:ribosomal protein S18 acetylase RimI-like enzyme